MSHTPYRPTAPPHKSEFVHNTAREKQSNALEHTKAIVRDFGDSSFQARRCRQFDFLLNGCFL